MRTQNDLKSVLSEVLRENLSSETQFNTPEKTLKYLAENYYIKSEGKDWPTALKLLQSEGN